MMPSSSSSSSSRVERVLGHLEASGTASASSSSPSSSSTAAAAAAAAAGSRGCSQRDDDVVLVSCVRTAVCKAKRGALASTSAVTMLEAVLREAVRRAGIDGGAVQDVCVGTVLAPGSTRANEARIAALLAGLPHTTAVRTVNRQCSSGLQAIADVAAAIRAGFIDVGIGAGVESMTSDAMAWSGGRIDDAVRRHAAARACLIPMGITSENVAAKFGVSRAAQDRVAAMSHARAAAAARSGRFRAEIVPVRTVLQQRDTGAFRELTVDADDGVREDTTAAALAALPAVFKKDGSTTAGNSSQISDGAAAAVLMSRATARKLGVRPMAVLRSFKVVGVPPDIMGIGPAVAIPQAVEAAALRLDDIDLFEINEAFASQAAYCVDKLGVSWDRVNVNGGAIALGHPLGCTGARMTATLLHEMARRRSRFGVVSMCIGSGMGAAAVFQAE